MIAFEVLVTKLASTVDSITKNEYPKNACPGPRGAIANDATPAENASMLKKNRQSGQALVAATFGLVVLIGATGLAIDIGYLRYQKRLQQSAADSAALAGAGDIAYIPDGASVGNAARADSTLNGFPNGGKVTVTVNHPSTLTPSSLNLNSVEVLITVAQPTFFMKIFGIGSANVTARAVALAIGKNVLYSLNGGITGTPTTIGGGRIDNQALIAQGAVPAADPLAYLKPPALGACLNQKKNPDPGVITGTKPPSPPPPPVTLNPGRYCGNGISVSGNASVIFNPGIYVITSNKGISLSGNGSITGTGGVTFYLAPGAGPVSIDQAVNLVAPTRGFYAGILFYQNPGNTASATIDGKGTATLEGALYFPDAALAVSDTGTGGEYTIAVAKSLSLTGTTHFAADFSSLPGGSPVKTAVLVE
jgi:hypothetical protein